MPSHPPQLTRLQRHSALLLWTLCLVWLLALGIVLQQNGHDAGWQPALAHPLAQAPDTPAPEEGPGPAPAIETTGEAGNTPEDSDPHRSAPLRRTLAAAPLTSNGPRLRVAGLHVPDPRLRLNPGNGPPQA